MTRRTKIIIAVLGFWALCAFNGLLGGFSPDGLFPVVLGWSIVSGGSWGWYWGQELL